MSGTEVQMDITPENLLAREAFFFFPTPKSSNELDTRTARDRERQSGSNGSYAREQPFPFSEQAIMRELNIGVSKMHQSLGHLRSRPEGFRP